MDSEIEGGSFVRLSSQSDLVLALENEELRPRLVILDDQFLDRIDEAILNTLRLKVGAAVAIAFRDKERVMRLLASRSEFSKGVSFLPMDLNVEAWLNIVRLLLTGYPFIPSELLQGTEASHPFEPTGLPSDTIGRSAQTQDKLTRRESEVLALLAQGLQNKHIADRLELSEHTVKLHVHHVIAKLGARNRTDAALRYRLRDGD
ncbi:MAG: response regulator transcription factor [Tabrizicola sp.]|nr:response regulator transcription factor [Tabrizicola sp.]